MAELGGSAGLKCLRENRAVPTGLRAFLPTLPSAESAAGLSCSPPTALHPDKAILWFHRRLGERFSRTHWSSALARPQIPSVFGREQQPGRGVWDHAV